MAPLLALAIKAFIPVLVSEAQKKLSNESQEEFVPPHEIPLSKAAPVAVKAAVVGSAKSKTVWFSVALGILGVLEANGAALLAELGVQNFGWVLVAIGGATAVLRSITAGSLLDK